MAETKISLDNFDEYNGNLDSPRSLEACKRQGIEPYELKYLSFEEYKKTIDMTNIDKETAKLLWKHSKEKRKEKFNLVCKVF